MIGESSKIICSAYLILHKLMLIKMKKQIIIGILGILIILAFANLVLADCIRQMHNGESIPCPGYYSQTKHQICDGVRCTVYGFLSDGGSLGVCVGNNGKCGAGCYSGSTQTECSDSGSGGGIPPVELPLSLTAIFPFLNNGFFTKTSFNLNIRTSKPCSIYLIDNTNGLQRNLCSNCISYTRPYTFKQGANDITIRAVKGNEIKNFDIKFIIDTKKPLISKTLPEQNKYASSVFTVFYSEENLKTVELYYGTSTSASNNKKQILNCTPGLKQSCSADVDLMEFDGKQINYWFKITDIANNIVESKKTKIYVDESAPKILNLSYIISKTYVTFKLKIEEKNLDKVYYYDNQDPRPKILCTSLKNGICEKKVSFRKGSHDVEIKVFDKAGSWDSKAVSFEIA